MRRSTRRRSASRVQCALIQALETRRLLASVGISSGVLTVNADNTNDTITIAPAVNNNVTVTLNGGTSTFAAANFTSILVNANGGNDAVTLSNSLTKPSTIKGGAGNDSLVGGGGNDVIDGGTGADTIKGGGGSDTVDYSARTGNLTVGLGTLNDDGELNEKDNVATDIETILGGSGADKLSGSVGNNLIVGNGGNDTLRGSFGNDTLTGGAGNDSLAGESGFDTLDGGAAGTDAGVNDKLDLLVSIETVINGIARSIRVGDDGKITITGTDTPTGADERDIVGVYVHPGPQLVINFGNDTYDFNEYHDVLVNLGGGDDYAEVSGQNAGAGVRVTLNGGGGNDTLHHNRDQGAAVTLSGGEGNDNLVGRTPATSQIDGGAGTDTFVAEQWISPTIDLNGFTSVENARANFFTSQSYTIIGTAGPNRLELGPDNLASTLIGNGGNDTLIGGDGADSLDGGDGTDSLFGAAGNDTLSGGPGTDTLNGGDGTDTGVNTAGDTLISIENTGGGGTPPWTIQPDGTLIVEGTAGNDVIFIAGLSNPLIHFNGTNHSLEDVIDQVNGVVLRGLGGNDTMETREHQFPGTTRVPITLDGGTGNDTFTIDDSRASIIGGTGDDRLIVEDDYIVDGFSDAGGTETVDIQSIIDAGFDLRPFPAIEHVVNGWGVIHGNALNNRIELSDFGGEGGTVFGGAGNDTILGYFGHDSLEGEAGNDSIDGGAGNDTIDGGAGGDTMKGGSGSDTADYSSRTGNLTIGLGTASDDGEVNEKDNVATDVETILGGSGNDSLSAANAGSAANLLVGNAGEDSLNGGAGNDTLDGGPGSDTLNGGDGNDTAINATGDILSSIENGGTNPGQPTGVIIDRKLIITGTNGDDEFFIGMDDEVLYGGAGTFPLGDFDSIEVYGLNGNDRITTLNVNFFITKPLLLSGGDGNDQFDLAESTRASIVGGAGNDSVVLREQSVLQTFDGGTGVDSVGGSSSFEAAFIDLRLYPTVENASLEVGEIIGNDLANALVISVEGRLRGGNGNDILRINSDEGFDNNLLEGGEGNDQLALSAGGGTLNGGGGNDTVSGSSVDDSIIGGSGNDSIEANEGDDTIDGGAGADLIKGGGGNDTVDYSSRSGNVTVGLGTMADDGEANEKDNLATDIETILGGSGNDTISAANAGTATNLLVGNGGNDSLFGGGGNDTLSGNAGTDTLNGGDGTDTATNSTGDTLISVENTSGGGGGGSAVITPERILLITGTSGADDVVLTLASPGGVDGERVTINGNVSDFAFADFDRIQIDLLGGDDVVLLNFTQVDAVTVNAGDGNDRVQLASSNATLVNGGDGNDTVQADEGGTQFDGGAGLDTYDDRNPDGDLDLRLMPTVENASILNGTLHGNDLPNHLESIEFGEIHGHGGDDVLIGGDPEVLSILHGEEGNDTLLGSEAGDSMFGGIGNDVLDGRGGGDTMQGGDGNDTVTYIGRTAGVRVGIGTLADDGEAGEGDNVYLDIETVIGGSGNDTITGGAANNRIVGNGGNDTLRGNYGDDTLVGGSGTDTLNGENGTDTAQDASGDVLVSIENS